MKILRLARRFLSKVAEREGFEPSIRDKPHTPLAGEINNSVDKFPDMELSDVAEIKIQKTQQLSLSLDRENEDTREDTISQKCYLECIEVVKSHFAKADGIDKDVLEELLEVLHSRRFSHLEWLSIINHRKTMH